jgi:hypothetical protein
VKPPTQPPTWRWRATTPTGQFPGLVPRPWKHGLARKSKPWTMEGEAFCRCPLAEQGNGQLLSEGSPPSGGDNPSGSGGSSSSRLGSQRRWDGTRWWDGTVSRGRNWRRGDGTRSWDGTLSLGLDEVPFGGSPVPKMRSTAPLTGRDTLSGAVSSTGHLRGTGQVRGTDSRSSGAQEKSGIKLFKLIGLRQVRGPIAGASGVTGFPQLHRRRWQRIQNICSVFGGDRG